MYTTEQYQGLTFGISNKVPTLDKNLVLSLKSTPKEQTQHLLNGRGVVGYGVLPDIGSVVVKQYHRGGLLGYINRSLYLGLFKYRPASEFTLLELARESGVNAPEPLAWIVKGRFLYSGWLVMREIEYQYSLAESNKLPQDRLLQILDSFAAQVSLLIRARIYHLDLHPGNVLVDRNNAVHLIDFDKASIFNGSLSDLRDRYLFRWRRAVIKHKLPDLLSEKVCATLRGGFSYRAV